MAAIIPIQPIPAVASAPASRPATLPALALTAEASLEGRFHQKVPSQNGIIQDEKPWHRHAARYLALGMTYEETARMCDCSKDQIKLLFKTPWFQDRVNEYLEANGQDIVSLFKGAALTAYATLIDIAEDPKSPASARVASAKELLDRHLGKAPQKLEVSDSSNVADPVARAAELEERLKKTAAQILPGS